MTCPFCFIVFEQFETGYIGHMLSEHPEAQLAAGIGFAALPLISRRWQTQLVAGLAISGLVLLYMRRGAR